MTNPVLVSEAMVRALARMAELPLAEGREESIASILDLWVRDANELSRKMSAAKYWALAPAMIFRHSSGS